MFPRSIARELRAQYPDLVPFSVALDVSNAMDSSQSSSFESFASSPAAAAAAQQTPTEPLSRKRKDINPSVEPANDDGMMEIPNTEHKKRKLQAPAGESAKSAGAPAGYDSLHDHVSLDDPRKFSNLPSTAVTAPLAPKASLAQDSAPRSLPRDTHTTLRALLRDARHVLNKIEDALLELH